MRRAITVSIAALALALSTAPLAAQQNAVMIQVLDGYSGVAIARHQISIALGATPAEVTARKHVQNTWTDERGVLMLPLPAGPTGWLQLWTSDMHSCELHPGTDSFSLAKIAATGVQAPNKCSHMSVHISPGHFVIYQREFTAAEYAAMHH